MLAQPGRNVYRTLSLANFCGSHIYVRITRKGCHLTNKMSNNVAEQRPVVCAKKMRNACRCVHGTKIFNFAGLVEHLTRSRSLTSYPYPTWARRLFIPARSKPDLFTICPDVISLIYFSFNSYKSEIIYPSNPRFTSLGTLNLNDICCKAGFLNVCRPRVTFTIFCWFVGCWF